jgi:hypothetical protein
LHEAGFAHGAIASSLVMEAHGATLLVEARRSREGATPADDLAEIASLRQRGV